MKKKELADILATHEKSLRVSTNNLSIKITKLQHTIDRCLDYEILLKKYITHVDISEDVDFLSDSYLSKTKVNFTKTEVEELRRIANKNN